MTPAARITTLPNVRFRFGPFELDAKNFELRRDGVLVPMQPKVFDVLACLVKRHGELVTKSELMDAVWPGLSVTKDSLAQAMMAVREALGDDVTAARYIQTIRGRGYRFVAEVEGPGGGAEPVRPLPSPDREARRPAAARSPLVGRDASLALVDEAFRRATSGRGSVVLVAGDAGVGKTAFLDAAGARSDDVTPIVATCVAAAGAPEPWAFVQIARELRRLGASRSPEVAALADANARFRHVEQLAAEVTQLATRAPVVLSFDDLHLADEHTLATLQVLVPLLRTARVVTLLAYRPRAAAHRAFDAAIGALSREPLAQRLTLEPFGREDVAAFVELRVGHRPEPAVLDKLVDKTKGNPLFLSQMVHVLRTEDRLKVTAPTTTLVGGEGMREAITQHLATLSELVVRTLTMAAVFGRTFAVAPLAASLERTNEAVLQDLDAAEAARIVARDGGAGYRFVYPLIRDVLYKKLPATERADLHRKAADALEQRLGNEPAHERVGEVAAHRADAAAAGDVDAAVTWSLRAARLAGEAGNRQAASAYARRGLDALAFAQRPDEARRAELVAFTRTENQPDIKRR